MKYVLLISHGTFAKGLHSVLDMMAGSNRNDILSTSLVNGMSVDTFEKNVEEIIKNINSDDELIVLADIIGGSPLTTTLNVLSKKGLLENTIAFGGANISLALNAVLMKDTLEGDELKKVLISESRESVQEFELNSNDNDEDI